MRRSSEPLRRLEAGSALVLALGALLFLGLFVAILVRTMEGPSRVLAASGQESSRVIEAESLLERARAIITEDPEADLTAIGVTANRSDSCTVVVSARSQDFTIEETWIVSSPSAFVLYADSVTALAESVVLKGETRVGSGACISFWLDTSPYLPLVTRTISQSDISDLRVMNEVVLLLGPAVRVENLEIDRGILLVEGDLLLEGTFEGERREGWPLVVVGGEFQSGAHGEAWRWKGLVAAGNGILLAGPAEFEGALVSRGVGFFGGVAGSALKEKPPPLGFPVRILRVGRRETWRG